MVLLNDFYTVAKLEKGEGVIEATVDLNKEHSIFDGHFPQQPVVPGVCTMQIINELTSQALEKDYRIAAGHNAKFIATIIPTKHSQIDFTIKYKQSENGEVSVNSVVRTGETICLKFKGSLKAAK